MVLSHIVEREGGDVILGMSISVLLKEVRVGQPLDQSESYFVEIRRLPLVLGEQLGRC
jgi:hypothetical protein